MEQEQVGPRRSVERPTWRLTDRRGEVDIRQHYLDPAGHDRAPRLSHGRDEKRDNERGHARPEREVGDVHRHRTAAIYQATRLSIQCLPGERHWLRASDHVEITGDGRRSDHPVDDRGAVHDASRRVVTE